MRDSSRGESRTDISGRDAVEDITCLAALRQEVISSVGLEYGAGILYGMGFIEGLVDGIRMLRGIWEEDAVSLGATSSRSPLLFRPEAGCTEARLSGTLRVSPEAQVQIAQVGEAPEPTCYLSAGYAAGWYSEILHETILIREIECEACGDGRCRFVGRTLAEWKANGDRWIAELLPYLDFEGLRRRAQELCRERWPVYDADDREMDASFMPEGDMFGNFDPMSPAAHVWGPVMVLPYAGISDGEACVHNIRSDLGPDQVRIVVLDVTGAQIGALEARSLVTLVDHLESLQMETIVTGVSPDADRLFQGRGHHLATPLFARTIAEGIALGFQLSLGTQHVH